MNLIVAKNGMGKSNLIEMLYYLSHLRAFRSATDKDLILHGQNHFQLFCDYEKKGIHGNVNIKYTGKKDILLDGKKIIKHSQKLLSSVFCFCRKSKAKNVTQKGLESTFAKASVDRKGGGGGSCRPVMTPISGSSLQLPVTSKPTFGLSSKVFFSRPNSWTAFIQKAVLRRRRWGKSCRWMCLCRRWRRVWGGVFFRSGSYGPCLSGKWFWRTYQNGIKPRRHFWCKY